MVYSCLWHEEVVIEANISNIMVWNYYFIALITNVWVEEKILPYEFPLYSKNYIEIHIT